MPRSKRRRVLFVGGGRRVSLASKFVAKGADVYGYELDTTCPLSGVAKEVVQGLPFSDADFRSHLDEHVSRLKITHVVPLMDAAVVACADVPGLVGSPSSAAMTCSDKRLFERWMKANMPSMYPAPCMVRYPKVAKPRFGHSSIGVRILRAPSAVELSPRYVVQDFVCGKEVSVDIWLSDSGVPAGYVARSRDRVEGGEVIESTILGRDESVVYGIDAAAVCCGIGIVGPANVQFRGSKVIEVNARFGGGAVLSIAAGFDMVSLALGLKSHGPPWSIVSGMRMTRYHAESFS
jgi:carbamoyl-phosphate synthase large subunit